MAGKWDAKKVKERKMKTEFNFKQQKRGGLKKFMAAFLAVVLIFSVSWTTVFASDVAGDVKVQQGANTIGVDLGTIDSSSATGNADAVIYDLPLNTEVPIVSEDGESTWFAFTPAEDGKYMFYSFDDKTGDPLVNLFDESWKFLASDDDSNNGTNFKLFYNLEAGQTYYYEARNYNFGSPFSYSVMLNRMGDFKITSLTTDQTPVDRYYGFSWGEDYGTSTPEKISITTADGITYSGSVRGVLNDIYYSYGVDLDYDYYVVGDPEWKAGNTITLRLDIEDFSCNYYYNLKASPITAVTADSVYVEEDEYYMDEDEIYNEATGEWETVEYKYYYTGYPSYITVTADGKTYSGSLGDVAWDLESVYGDEPDNSRDTHQSYKNQWTSGNTYKCDFTFGGFTTTYDVTVVDKIKHVESLTLNKTEATMKAGETLKLTATVLPADTTYNRIVWYSDDTDVVKVDSSGNVTVVGPGSTWVNAYIAGENAYAECRITVPYDLSAAYVTIPDQTYYGGELKPDPEVKLGKEVLENGYDYTVSYKDNINAGTATAIITGIGEFEGESTTGTFTIKPIEVTPVVKVSATSFTFNNKVQRPQVTSVMVGSEKVDASGYTVAPASGSKNAGSYKLTVTLKGNFSGSATVNYTIKKANQKITAKSKAPAVKAAKVAKKNQTIKKAKAFTLKNAQGKVTYKLSKVAKSKFKKYFSINKKTGNITVKKGLKKKGTYTLTIKAAAAGGTNYNKATKTFKVKVKVK